MIIEKDGKEDNINTLVNKYLIKPTINLLHFLYPNINNIILISTSPHLYLYSLLLTFLSLIFTTNGQISFLKMNFKLHNVFQKDSFYEIRFLKIFKKSVPFFQQTRFKPHLC